MAQAKLNGHFFILSLSGHMGWSDMIPESFAICDLDPVPIPLKKCDPRILCAMWLWTQSLLHSKVSYDPIWSQNPSRFVTRTSPCFTQRGQSQNFLQYVADMTIPYFIPKVSNVPCLSSPGTAVSATTSLLFVFNTTITSTSSAASVFNRSYTLPVYSKWLIGSRDRSWQSLNTFPLRISSTRPLAHSWSRADILTWSAENRRSWPSKWSPCCLASAAGIRAMIPSVRWTKTSAMIRKTSVSVEDVSKRHTKETDEVFCSSQTKSLGARFLFNIILYHPKLFFRV